MSAHNTLSKAFNDAANSAESMRQVGVTTASGTGAVLQANIMNVELTYYRTLRSLAITNGLSPSNFNQAIKSLGWQT
jgi:hypothetical protein